jgi:hypothetical protein
MKRTTALYDPDISHILSKHYDIDIKSQDKKYLDISKARSDDKKAIVPGLPYIKAAKDRKAEQLWRCVNTTTEHELAKAIGEYDICFDCFSLFDLNATNLVHIELKQSTREAESQLAGLRQRIDVVHPEHRLIPKLEVILYALLSHALDSYRRSELEKRRRRRGRYSPCRATNPKHPSPTWYQLQETPP